MSNPITCPISRSSPIARERRRKKEHLPELRRTASHNLSLADKFGTQFRTVEREVDIEIDTIECSLWSVHTLKVLLQVLAAEIRGEGDDFLDAYTSIQLEKSFEGSWECLRGSLVYSGHTSSSQAYRMSSYIRVAPGATCLKKLTLYGSPILTFWPFCTKIWRVYLHLSFPSKDGTRYCSG